MQQRDFFISYTKTDKRWALWIADVLTRNGYSSYVQALDIRPGDDFLEKMEEFLENSRNFIVVWSKGYSKSRYCMNELRAAFHEWNAGRINCLLPVRVDDFPMKALYAALVHVELSDMGAASEATLADAVRRAVPRPLMAEMDAQTLYQRGVDYYWGRNGVPQDYTKSREYHEQAVKKGYTQALRNLGWLYEHGLGVHQNYIKALAYYKQAATKGGYAEAFINLASLYERGYGVKQDYAKAREYYQQAADKGNAYALYLLGVLHENGYGVAQDYAKARDYYQQAADKGDSWGLKALGVLYYHGHGVSQNYAKALDYYRQAADKSNVEAMYNLGFLYENGKGVAVDYAKALEYYQKAADAGNKDAPAQVERLRKMLNS